MLHHLSHPELPPTRETGEESLLAAPLTAGRGRRGGTHFGTCSMLAFLLWGCAERAQSWAHGLPQPWVGCSVWGCIPFLGGWGSNCTQEGQVFPHNPELWC